jgi:aminoglycoside phosphotransferase (APT) family kinase protein
MPFDPLTPDLACEALMAAGLRVAPAEVTIERREGRWLVRLPAARLAWFAASAEAIQRLAIERRVLRLLEERCRFAAPRVLFEASGGDFDVRSMVPGAADPWRVYAAACAEPAVAVRLGAAIGEILAEQHTRIGAADVAGWLPHRPDWPASSSWIEARLPAVVDDAGLWADARQLLAIYEAAPTPDADRVLVHGDVGFHNLGIDPASFAVHGIFDYEEPAWADRHHDFRYLVFDLDRFDLLDAMRAVYEPVVGRAISLARVLLYNAACALTFIDFIFVV